MRRQKLTKDKIIKSKHGNAPKQLKMRMRGGALTSREGAQDANVLRIRYKVACPGPFPARFLILRI